MSHCDTAPQLLGGLQYHSAVLPSRPQDVQLHPVAQTLLKRYLLCVTEWSTQAASYQTSGVVTALKMCINEIRKILYTSLIQYHQNFDFVLIRIFA
jgi:hypothetical protein